MKKIILFSIFTALQYFSLANAADSSPKAAEVKLASGDYYCGGSIGEDRFSIMIKVVDDKTLTWGLVVRCDTVGGGVQLPLNGTYSITTLSGGVSTVYFELDRDDGGYWLTGFFNTLFPNRMFLVREPNETDNILTVPLVKWTPPSTTTN